MASKIELNRRAGLKVLGTFLAAFGLEVLLSGCTVVETPEKTKRSPTVLATDPVITTGEVTGNTPEVSFVSDDLKRYGSFLREWKINGGEMEIVKAIPQLGVIVSFLNGEIDPREALPFAKMPIEIGNLPDGQSGGRLEINHEFAEIDGKWIVVKPPGEKSEFLPLLKNNLDVQILMEERLKNIPNFDLVVLSSMVGQLLDYSALCELYIKQTLESRGVKVDYFDADGDWMYENFMYPSLAAIVGMKEKEGNEYLGFEEFLEMATVIRHTGIVNANWRLYYNSEIELDPPKHEAIEKALKGTTFLFDEGLFSYDRVVRWANGGPPAIDANLFELANRLFFGNSSDVHAKNNLIWRI